MTIIEVKKVMSSFPSEEVLDDIPINDFKGATLRIDPSPAQHSNDINITNYEENKSR